MTILDWILRNVENRRIPIIFFLIGYFCCIAMFASVGLTLALGAWVFGVVDIGVVSMLLLIAIVAMIVTWTVARSSSRM